MNIGIIGLGNMGKFHAREFDSIGENVSAVLAMTKNKAEEARKYLQENLKIDSKGFYSFGEFVKEGRLDAVSICTPLNSHYPFIKESLNNGLHVMCEKPFTGSLTEAKEVLSLARKKKLVLTVNTQWPSILRNLSIPSKIYSFEITMQPGTSGKDMLEDHLPHMLSLLIKLCGKRKISGLNFLKKTETEIILYFDYSLKNKKTRVKFNLLHKADRPRIIEFKINETLFQRIIGPNYSQSILVDRKNEVAIVDPLRASIRKFVEAIKKRNAPLITSKEILIEMELREEIISAGIF